MAEISCVALDSLPDRVLSQILSLLSTKEAACCILSRKLRHVFSLITNVDLEDLPISHCMDSPHLIERFPAFIQFANTVLGALSQANHNLSRYRLAFGGEIMKSKCKKNPLHLKHRICTEGCFPNLEPTYVDALIRFPLARSITELDLCIYVSEPGELPPEIFTCETLQVLKLDTNLYTDEVSYLPSFHLPVLKVLHLHSFFFTDDDFLTRLVSSCPSLQVLESISWWIYGDIINVSSPSLRTLALTILRDHEDCDELKNCDALLIDTPNLHSFSFCDNLPREIGIKDMNSLLTANLETIHYLQQDTEEVSYAASLSLISSLSKARHLTLSGSCLEELDWGELKDELPVFNNLKYLSLDMNVKWDKVLMTFLHCSPFLETLVFPQGLTTPLLDKTDEEAYEFERMSFGMATTIPLCCTSYLRKIEIGLYKGTNRDLNLIQFFLSHTPLLEEMAMYARPNSDFFPMEHPRDIESRLKNLPRASTNCSIQVQVKSRR